MLYFGMQRLYVRLVRPSTFLTGSSTEQSVRLTKVNSSLRVPVIFNANAVVHSRLDDHPHDSLHN